MMLIDTEQAAKTWLRATLSVDDGTFARLERLEQLLREENERQNLIAKGTLPHIWVRHIVDSAQLLAVPRETVPNGPWLDLGTGAGFPGLAIAALQPDRPMTLVDSRRLRTDWLRRAVNALGLNNVRVIQSRVEDLPNEQFSVISARAFAPLEKLLEISARFSTPETLWVLPKGASASHELQALSQRWRHVFHVEQSLTDSAAGIVTGHLLGDEPQSKSAKRQQGKRK